MSALHNLGEAGATVNSTPSSTSSTRPLDENVKAFTTRYPFLRHFVWNNLDPSMGRAETNRDTRIAWRLRALVGARDALLAQDRPTFRVEAVPLCYMTEFAHCSTENAQNRQRRGAHRAFLDEKGTVRQTDFRHPKAESCKHCTLNDVCGGLFELGEHYDLGELHPVFVSKEDIPSQGARGPGLMDLREALLALMAPASIGDAIGDARLLDVSAELGLRLIFDHGGRDVVVEVDAASENRRFAARSQQFTSATASVTAVRHRQRVGLSLCAAACLRVRAIDCRTPRMRRSSRAGSDSRARTRVFVLAHARRDRRTQRQATALSMGAPRSPTR